MEKMAFAVRSPLEVGDIVRAHVNEHDMPYAYEVTDIFAVHSARTGNVGIVYELDWRFQVPLDYIECRIVCGRDVPLGDELSVCGRVS